MKRLACIIALSSLTALPALADNHESSGDTVPPWQAIGIGAGYTFPSDLDAINTVSARFRLGRVTIEPIVDLSYNKIGTDNGTGGTNDTDILAVAAGANARVLLAQRGGAELVVLGGGQLAYGSVDPEGDDNNTTVTTVTVQWGIGVDYWLSQRWVVSMSAYNPFFEFSSTKQQSVGDDSKNTETGIGAIFDPTMVGMVHLFF